MVLRTAPRTSACGTAPSRTLSASYVAMRMEPSPLLYRVLTHVSKASLFGSGADGVQEVSESNPAYFTLLFEDPNSGPNAFVFLPEVWPGIVYSSDDNKLAANWRPQFVVRDHRRHGISTAAVQVCAPTCCACWRESGKATFKLNSGSTASSKRLLYH